MLKIKRNPKGISSLNTMCGTVNIIGDKLDAPDTDLYIFVTASKQSTKDFGWTNPCELDRGSFRPNIA